MDKRHTLEEKERIDRGWVFTLYWAERSRGLKQNLEEVMKKDKKQRSTFQVTRALMMKMALRIHFENPSMVEVADEDETLILGGLLAYRALRNSIAYGKVQEAEQLITLMEGAVSSHKLSIERRLKDQFSEH